MGLDEFIHHVRVLNDASRKVSELLDLLQVGDGCDNFIDNLGIEYAELVLSIVSHKEEIPDELYEQFWNNLVYSDCVTDEQIRVFYEKLQ